MNAQTHAGLDWRAALVGGGIAIALGIGVSWLAQAAIRGGMAPDSRMVYLAMAIAGLLVDAIGGAVAGAIARRQGALHGVVACALATFAGLAFTILMVQKAGVAPASLGATFWAQWVAQALLGFAAAAVAGLLAARIAARVSANPPTDGVA
jgi:hypothetical protein